VFLITYAYDMNMQNMIRHIHILFFFSPVFF